MKWLHCSLVPILVACGNDEIEWERVNGNGASIDVHVTDQDLAADFLLTGIQDIPAKRADAPLGEWIVTPEWGPVGTEHEVAVTVYEDHEELVQKVTVIMKSARGRSEWELERDPAFIGSWGLVFESLGAADEKSRVDTFELRLWTPVEDPEEP